MERGSGLTFLQLLLYKGTFFINTISLNPQLCYVGPRSPFQRLNSLPRQMCSSYHPALLCMARERALPPGKFPQILNQLDVCCWATPRRLWQRTGSWAVGWVNQDGFPSFSLCRAEASRSFVPSEVPMVLGLQDQCVPRLSTLLVGMAALLLIG